MRNNCLPDFLGIGAQKSGTSWLYQQLKTHPEVFMPEKKELRFFLGNQPESGYAQHFISAGHGQKKGEITPEYMVIPAAIEKIYALLPEAKIFCILRNPTERAFSQWKMARRLGNIPKEVPFMEAFKNNLQYIRERGHYIDHINKISRYYVRDEQFLILFYDELEISPQLLLQRLYRFIGVDDGWKSPVEGEVFGKSRDPRKISHDDEIHLIKYYKPYVELLSEALDKDLGHWNMSSVK